MLYAEQLNQSDVYKFEETFKVPLLKFCDKPSTMLRKRFTIDIVIFDEWIQKQFKEDYIEGGLSLAEYLKERFSNHIKMFVESLL